MSHNERSPEDVQRDNDRIISERGPGLYVDLGTYVIARRPSTGEILIGGLGSMGVGEMWFTESADHRSRPGYADAEIVR